MRKIIVGMVIVIFSICFFLDHSVAQTKTILLKAFTNWPVTNNNVDGFKHFIQLVNERAKGKLEIKLMGGPTDIGQGVTGGLGKGCDGHGA